MRDIDAYTISAARERLSRLFRQARLRICSRTYFRINMHNKRLRKVLTRIGEAAKLHPQCHNPVGGKIIDMLIKTLRAFVKNKTAHFPYFDGRYGQYWGLLGNGSPKAIRVRRRRLRNKAHLFKYVASDLLAWSMAEDLISHFGLEGFLRSKPFVLPSVRGAFTEIQEAVMRNLGYNP